MSCFEGAWGSGSKAFNTRRCSVSRLRVLTNFLFDNMRLSGYQINMKKEAQLFKSLADETRLKIFWLLMGREELCVCDIMGVLGITQSKASRLLSRRV
jgi:Bacterial regulatory protein, arsR family